MSLDTYALTTSTDILAYASFSPPVTPHSAISTAVASNRSSIGAIAGGVGGGVGGLIVLIFLTVFCIVRIICSWKSFLSHPICSVEFVNKEAWQISILKNSVKLAMVLGLGLEMKDPTNIKQVYTQRTQRKTLQDLDLTVLWLLHLRSRLICSRHCLWMN